MSADFIYTLDSEPESDVERDEDAHGESSKAVTGTSSASPSKVGRNGKNPASKDKDKSKTKKSSSTRPEGLDEDVAAPAIDPSFSFDLGGGADGTTFFDGLGGGDEMGDADEVRTGTKPVCLGISIVALESNLILTNSLTYAPGTYLSGRYH
jgi:hypothetical protein